MSASGTKPSLSFQENLLHNYRLLALVGQGEFAQVYCAVHRHHGRLVAIKQTRHSRERESQEPLVMQRLKHPNVVDCYAFSRAVSADGDAGYQLVLEYCEGGSLRSLLNSSKNTAMPLSPIEIQALIEDILTGLSYLHQRGVIHGDLKPENIFLSFPHSPRVLSASESLNPVAKIGDFGSARLMTRSGREERGSKKDIGSPTYAAPERFDGYMSIASDLYSVGVMLYEMLTGDRPFSGSPELLKAAHQIKAVPWPATLPSAAQDLLAIALHKQPRKRFSSAEAMLRAARRMFSSTGFSNAEYSLPVSATPIALSHTSLSQKAIAIPSYGITAPVESLLSVPQGCCLITEHSLHLITARRELLSIARFRHPCWIAVSPDGKWFVALPKQTDLKQSDLETMAKTTPNTNPDNSLDRVRKTDGMLGSLSSRSGHQWRRSMTLEGPLLTRLCANVLQVVAINSRYFLRVSTTSARTFLECFTRSGRFVGEMSLNMVLTQVVPTAVPYQLIGLARRSTSPAHQSDQANQTNQANRVPVLISLKPLKVEPIRLSIEPESVSAVPWGYFIGHQRSALFLDQSAQPLSQLSEVPQNSAIAAISSSQILIASNKRPPNQRPQVTAGVSLLVADVRSLNLDIIF